jgi:hypothetical protein
VYAATECVAVIVASLVVAMTWPWVVGCALIEGTLLGLGQGWLLHGKRGSLVLRWTLATAAGVLIGRFIEYSADISPAAAGVLTLPLALQILAGAVLGAVVGAASGSFQALLLRGRVEHPLRWIAVCSAAWALTLPGLLVVGAAAQQLSALSLWQSALAVIGLFVAVGALAGAIEGAGLAWLFAARELERAGLQRFAQRSRMPLKSASLTGLDR